MASLLGAQVPSLVGKLRLYMLQGEAKKKKKVNNNNNKKNEED